MERTFVTTEPAPTVLPCPILTPAKMMTLPPIHASSSICTSFPASGPSNPRRTAGSMGWIAP
ncbi:hypothetical protein BO71DRAFT_329210 [Aspergillus ellipticus CBS 707.79]|uniref:Uncharacterized protein n=1 Tax=Aspergillus ellipticus CBS 707.79 TaxID=1448320 RepID=A0A319D6E9_9EURO|nr:hypothetical protein BO71DRAFT_329210 [Aspergillus ellipticus CBS 707.79]